MRRKMHQGICSSNLTTHGSKIESPKLWMAVGIKLLSLLSVKHQQLLENNLETSLRGRTQAGAPLTACSLFDEADTTQ